MNSNASAIDITISNTAANRCLDVAFLNHSMKFTSSLWKKYQLNIISRTNAIAPTMVIVAIIIKIHFYQQ